MKLLTVIATICILAAGLAQVTHAVTLTFDDIPQGETIRYYEARYNIGFTFEEFAAVDHLGSVWGPPHSESNVLANTSDPARGYSFMGFKTFNDPMGSKSLYAYSISGYFSTEPGVVLLMTGYHDSQEVTSVLIGAPGQSWNNAPVRITSQLGISWVTFVPVTTGALVHFCADDIEVNFVPEPTSLLALCGGLIPLALRRRRG